MKTQHLTPVQDVIRFRLRRGDRVVGWMREESTGQMFFSRDGLWWSGRRIEWTDRDRCSGLQDVDGRWLHEGDVLQPVACPWWQRRHRWGVACSVESGWAIYRNSPLRGWLREGESEMESRQWRWAGVVWR